MKARHSSVAVMARDGVKLAVDVALPPDGERFAAVLNQCRYWRSYLARGQRSGATSTIPPSTHHPRTADLVRAGFAVVNADTRGTGASEGSWPIMWSDKEAADSADLVEWIARQPWCDGRVLAAGLSYEGTTAVLAGTCGHEAMRGSVARGFEWDVYDDIVAPGGVMNEGFLRVWSDACRDLDDNRAPSLFGWARYIVKGVRPLDDDPDGKTLAGIVGKRANPVVWDCVKDLGSADDEYGSSGTSLRQVSLCSRERLRTDPGAPMQLWGSWLDGTTSRSVLRMFENVPEVREVYIGAWSHTGEHGASLGRRSRPDPSLEVQFERQIEFLRTCLHDPPRSRVLRYYTMGEDAWHDSTQWPPVGTTIKDYSLTAAGELVEGHAGEAPGLRDYAPDATTSTGKGNRWHTQNARPVSIADRKDAARRMLVWRTEPLQAPLEMTGEPELAMTLKASYGAPAVFAYLELVDPRGEVFYVTEAIMRGTALAGRQARLALRFYPTSVRIPAGWRLQLGLAATDADTMPVAFPSGSSWEIAVGGDDRGFLSLPVRSPVA